METLIKGGKFRGGGDSVSYTIVSEQGASVYRDGKMAGPRLRDPGSLASSEVSPIRKDVSNVLQFGTFQT